MAFLKIIDRVKQFVINIVISDYFPFLVVIPIVVGTQLLMYKAYSEMRLKK